MAANERPDIETILELCGALLARGEATTEMTAAGLRSYLIA
jgi:hypothetical protein